MWYVRHRHTLAAASPEPLILNFQTALDARGLDGPAAWLGVGSPAVFIAIAIDDAVRDAALDTTLFLLWAHPPRSSKRCRLRGNPKERGRAVANTYRDVASNNKASSIS